MANYIDELNESQRAAVLYNEGPSLVIAGAGSGKTRVLTYKIAYLLELGYEPWSILALTFTNKAAREMKARIAKQVGEQSARYLWMGTFHSVFSRILRVEAESIGFTSNFTIYDTSDSKSLIRSIIKEMQLDEKAYKPGAVQGQISNAKNHLMSPDAYAVNRELTEHDNACKMPAIRDIYRRYWDRCRQSGAMDFDDLLFYTFLLFRDHPEILRKYQQQFKYILVDEYQDTNFAQHSIVLQLSKEHQKVCVVGDDAQSIYSFRGANIDNILKFTKLYQNTQVFKLEQNYRSTKTIVRAANSLIEKNREQIRKEVFSEKSQGEPIGVFQAYSDMEEGDIVSNKIMELRMSQHYGYDDFAILYRTNAQSRIFEEALRKRNLPYKIYGGLSFYQRKEIKDVIAYFRLVVNPNDEEAFKRIINYPARGIGDTTVGKIIEAANTYSVSLWDVLCGPLEYGLNINKGTHTKLQGFREIIENFSRVLSERNAYKMATSIVKEAGIVNDIYLDRTPENLSRQENIEELVNGIHDFCAIREEEGNENIYLSDFLSEVSLLSDQDTDKSGDEARVTLMTIHSAKGLEFRNVFIVGLEENLFPSNMAGDSPRAMEEERRLFYVAITRAEDHCFLSFAKTRFRYGKMEFANPSRFLRDIDSSFLKLPSESVSSRHIDEAPARFKREQNDRPVRSLFNSDQEKPKQTFTKVTIPRNLTKMENAQPKPSSSAPITDLQSGQQIEHERFGIGEVINVEGSGENLKATVRFRNAGEKQLLLKFARFKVIS
ncbi:UvrD-helicase domain-containing protein [uncultured Bacteroides sp.]|uniref:ATP-dependent helicase n=1 Tax=uncultured Bacteroides sp. TaxID=162156 RepID=UPI002AAA79E8|nr:UvrD-helicase domain-containing protein [uncultured Bacteroides sp.]